MEEFEMELTVKVKVVFEATKAEPRTLHYPGDPADIEILEIRCPSGDALLKLHEDEIKQECWDYLREAIFFEAEHRYDSMMDR